MSLSTVACCSDALVFDGTTVPEPMRAVTSTSSLLRATSVTTPTATPSSTTFARNGRLSTLSNARTMSYPSR